MGNYLFTTDALVDAVDATPADESSRHDFGGDIIPMLSSAARRTCTTSRTNNVPGATERERGYWRDVGTLDAYYEAHMDLISVDPIFNLYNREWPILTLARAAPAGEVRLRGRGPHAATRPTRWSARA